MARGSFLVSREAARILIDQEMGGDLVYIVSKNAVFAGPNNVAYGASKADQAHQVRLLAAELGAVRHPGQRRQPRRRRPRLRHLRQGLGRRPRADLRHPGGQARRVLRAADAAQAGGPARARRGGRVRPDRRRPVARRPGCTSRSTPAWRRPSCGERRAGVASSRPSTSARSSGRVMVGRVGAADELRARPRSIASPTSRSRLPDGLHWDILRPLSRGRSPACASAAAGGRTAWSASASTRGASTTACSTRPARLRRRPRSTTATTGRTASTAARPRGRPARPTLRADRASQLLPFNTHLPARRRRAAAPSFDAARTMLLIPDLFGYWLSGVPGRGGHQRLDDGAARRPSPDLGRRS